MTANQKMKIAFISSMDMPVPDKMGAAVEKLMTHIIEENEKQKQLNIDLYTIKSANKIPQYNYTRVIEISPRSRIYHLSRRVINKILRTIKLHEITKSPSAKHVKTNLNAISNYDLVVIENNMSIAEAVAKKTLTPIIYHVHNQLENGDKSPKRWKKLSPKLTDVITISKYMQAEYTTKHRLPKILLNAIDLQQFNPDTTVNLRSKFHIEKNDIVIGYAGRINAEKGIDELISAFIKSKFPNNVKLLIIGDSWYGNKKHDNFTKKLLEKTKTLKNQIIFTGIIKHDDMPKIYKTIDILASPTLIEEALSVTVVEAKAMGLPVIITNSGGMVELVKNNINGLIVDKNNNLIDGLSLALKTLVNNKHLRKKMGDKNRNEIASNKKFSKTEYYKEFVDILAQAVNQKT